MLSCCFREALLETRRSRCPDEITENLGLYREALLNPTLQTSVRDKRITMYPGKLDRSTHLDGIVPPAEESAYVPVDWEKELPTEGT